MLGRRDEEGVGDRVECLSHCTPLCPPLRSVPSAVGRAPGLRLPAAPLRAAGGDDPLRVHVSITDASLVAPPGPGKLVGKVVGQKVALQTSDSSYCCVAS